MRLVGSLANIVEQHTQSMTSRLGAMSVQTNYFEQFSWYQTHMFRGSTDSFVARHGYNSWRSYSSGYGDK